MNTESALSVFWPCVAWMLIVFRAIPLLSTFLKQEERETLCSRDTAGISLLLYKQCSVLKDHPKINVHFTIIIVIWISATSRFWRTYCTWSELCDLDQNCGDLTELSSKGTWRNEPVPFLCAQPATATDPSLFGAVARSYLVIRMNIAWVLQHSMGFGAAPFPFPSAGKTQGWRGGHSIPPSQS